MRINVYLAEQLGSSRRAADRMIEEKRVKVNGRPAKLGLEIDLGKDRIAVDGKLIRIKEREKVTIILYKPRGYVSTRSDPKKRKTVMDLLPHELKNVKPVGRLDYESEGLLLMSNDGQFILESTHPRFEKEKEYRLVFKKPISQKLLDSFERGIRFAEGIAKADRVNRIDKNEISVVIHQGWNRQLRRMAEACHADIARLIRVRSGDIELGDLKPGEWREVDMKEHKK